MRDCKTSTQGRTNGLPLRSRRSSLGRRYSQRGGRVRRLSLIRKIVSSRSKARVGGNVSEQAPVRSHTSVRSSGSSSPSHGGGLPIGLPVRFKWRRAVHWRTLGGKASSAHSVRSRVRRCADRVGSTMPSSWGRAGKETEASRCLSQPWLCDVFARASDGDGSPLLLALWSCVRGMTTCLRACPCSAACWALWAS